MIILGLAVVFPEWPELKDILIAEYEDNKPQEDKSIQGKFYKDVWNLNFVNTHKKDLKFDFFILYKSITDKRECQEPYQYSKTGFKPKIIQSIYLTELIDREYSLTIPLNEPKVEGICSYEVDGVRACLVRSDATVCFDKKLYRYYRRGDQVFPVKDIDLECVNPIRHSPDGWSCRTFAEMGKK